MKSTRVLLSDRHAHTFTLTEQEIGVAMHALNALWMAFSEEAEYKGLIVLLLEKLELQLNEQTHVKVIDDHSESR